MRERKRRVLRPALNEMFLRRQICRIGTQLAQIPEPATDLFIPDLRTEMPARVLRKSRIDIFAVLEIVPLVADRGFCSINDPLRLKRVADFIGLTSLSLRLFFGHLVSLQNERRMRLQRHAIMKKHSCQ